MTFNRRLLTPRLTSGSLDIHDEALPAYQIWTCLGRQFEAGSLVSGAPCDLQLDPLHAVKVGTRGFRVFAGFPAYQELVALMSETDRSQVTILCYSDLDRPDIELLSLRWLLRFIEGGCLDRLSGLEQLRASLVSWIDRRTLEQVCGSPRMSRSAFAPRANVPPSVLKAQAGRTLLRQEKRVSARDYVLRRLET